MHVLETRLEDRGRGLPSQLAEGGSSEDFERHAVKSWTDLNIVKANNISPDDF